MPMKRPLATPTASLTCARSATGQALRWPRSECCDSCLQAFDDGTLPAQKVMKRQSKGSCKGCAKKGLPRPRWKCCATCLAAFDAGRKDAADVHKQQKGKLCTRCANDATGSATKAASGAAAAQKAKAAAQKQQRAVKAELPGLRWKPSKCCTACLAKCKSGTLQAKQVQKRQKGCNALCKACSATSKGKKAKSSRGASCKRLPDEFAQPKGKKAKTGKGASTSEPARSEGVSVATARRPFAEASASSSGEPPALAFASASGQRREACHELSCNERARVEVDGHNYCKAHALWHLPGRERQGLHAYRQPIEAWRDQGVLQHVLDGGSCTCEAKAGEQHALSCTRWVLANACPQKSRAATTEEPATLEKKPPSAVQTCNALYFNEETVDGKGGKHFSLCCGNGKLASLPIPRSLEDRGYGAGALLRGLLTDKDTAGEFRRMVRRYNSAMQFVSFGDPSLERGRDLPGKGPPVFAIQGQTYHSISAMIPEGDSAPAYCQFYLYDPNEALMRRSERFSDLDDGVMDTLHKMLLYDCSTSVPKGAQKRRVGNRYARQFLHMRDLMHDKHTSGAANFCLTFAANSTPDPRRYNVPSGSDIAAIFDDTDKNPRDLRVYLRREEGGGTQQIPYLSEHVDPLTYPLLFPDGQVGYRPHMEYADKSSKTRKNKVYVSMAEFYSHRLMVRADPSSTLPTPQQLPQMPHAGGRLFQQYAVDVYSRIEKERLDWCRKNQATLRCERLAGLLDYLHEVDGASANMTTASDSAPTAAQGPPAEASASSSRGPPVSAVASEGEPGATSKGPTAQEYTGEYSVPVPKVGRPVLLPSSFSGSPRALQQNYLDAMTIVKTFGKPDLFITMTANPNWPEIRDNLRAGEEPVDRPDLTVRVFRAKLKELMHLLVHKGVLGAVVAFTYAIEFQKRGLPHAHILLVLTADSKPRTAADYDTIVSAELPAGEHQRQLRELVEQHMLHGPCGSRNPNCPCMKAGVCSKGYPKAFLDTTLPNAKGYPFYRRRDDGQCSEKHHLTNQHVVPYNPGLLLKFRCHLNVEICSSIKAVKYLYKYTYKGPDRAKLSLDNPLDEIQRFMDARYLTAPEAAWRTFRFPLYEKSHVVERLPVHNQCNENVLFEAGEEREAARKAMSSSTKLDAYFNLNKTLPPEQRVLYSDVPRHYLWDGPTQTWRKRKCGKRAEKVLGRLHTVNFKDEERYFLRALLLNISDATCWEDLRARRDTSGAMIEPDYEKRCTFEARQDANGQAFQQRIPIPDLEHESFKSAAESLGFLEDDDLARDTLQEAINFAPCTEKGLRTLFASLLVWLHVKNPAALWEEFKHELAEKPDNGEVTEDGVQQALAEVHELLRDQHWKPPETEDECRLPEPKAALRDTSLDAEVRKERARSINEPTQNAHHYQQRAEKLNPQQKLALAAVDAALQKEPAAPKLIWIDGPAGSGKTYFYVTLLHKARSEGRLALPMSMNGIAALLLPGGRTVHSRFGLPVPLPLQDACSTLRLNSPLAQLLKEAELLIWDEGPTAPLAAFEVVDSFLRDLMGNDEPCGGKTLVIGGDFRQIPPVLRRVDPENTRAYTLRSWKHWPTLVKIPFHRNERAIEDEDWAAFVLALGDGDYKGFTLDDTAATLDDTAATNPTPPAEASASSTRGPPASASASTGQHEDNRKALHPATIMLPPDIAPPNMTKEELIDWVYEGMGTTAPEDFIDYYSGRAILTPTNAEADALNQRLLMSLPGTTARYVSRDEVLDATEEEKAHFPEEFLNDLENGGMPPHNLVLAKGALLIVLRNLNPQEGLCNGTRVVVREMHQHSIQVQIVSEGPHKGRVTTIHRIFCDSSSEAELPFVLRRRQFPVRHAWVLTINKAQGQTLKARVGLYLPKPVFAHGQLYVAFSRVGARQRIRCVLEPWEDQQGHFQGDESRSDGAYTFNVVDPSLLHDPADVYLTADIPAESKLEQSAQEQSLPVSVPVSSAQEHSSPQSATPPAATPALGPPALAAALASASSEAPLLAPPPAQSSAPETAGPDTEDHLLERGLARSRKSNAAHDDTGHYPTDEASHATLANNAALVRTHLAKRLTTTTSSRPPAEPGDEEEDSGDENGDGLEDTSYPYFFERQTPGQARCGMHALNNLLRGEHHFLPEDLSEACTTLLWEKTFDGWTEARRLHERKSGWYSEEVLAKALQATMQYELLLEPLSNNPGLIHAPEIMGALSNIRNQHWVAFIAVENMIWRLDSLRKPEQTTEERYHAHLRAHGQTYPVRRKEGSEPAAP